MVIPELKAEVSVDLSKVAEDFYTEAAKDSIQEVSKIGVDAVKTIRLALLPLQLTAAYQDRVARWIDKTIRSVPEPRRVAPIPSLALPIIEKLKYFDDGELLGNMYSGLLSRTFDRDRLGEAHPAFVNVISQLSPDEAKLINILSSETGKVYFGLSAQEWTVSFDLIASELQRCGFPGEPRQWLPRFAVDPEALNFPSYLQMYVHHLQSLGLITYNNTSDPEFFSVVGNHEWGKKWWTIELTSFGRLFHLACIKDSLESGLRANRD